MTHLSVVRPMARAAFAASFLVVLTGAPAARATDPARVEWSDDWPRVHVWEIVSAVGLTIGDTLFETYVPLTKSSAWHGGILFDDWAHHEFLGRSASFQSTASTVSDIFFKAGALFPFVVDDFFGALSIHQNADVGVQLMIIDLQSFGIAGLVSLAAEHSIGRARPYTEECDLRDPSTGQLLHSCGSDNDNRSFYSGHATSTATSAGLVCVHHQHLPLFGGGFADLAPCLAMIGVSVATGYQRLVYDEHWASDVIVGWVDGFLSGYVLPSLLHFGYGHGRPVGVIRSGSLEMAPTLAPVPGGAGGGVVGVF